MNNSGHVSVIEREARQSLSRIAKLNPGEYLIMAGDGSRVIVFCDSAGRIQAWEMAGK